MRLKDFIEFQITKNSDEDLFNDIAKFIENEFGIIYTEKINGLDQKYWDLKLDNQLFTLHLEHSLGISIHSYNTNDQSKSKLKAIEKVIKSNF